MEAIVSVVALFVLFYGFGYFMSALRAKRLFKKPDGQIKVDGYELKGLVLDIDVPEIATKKYLIIEIKHEDQS